MLLYDKFLYKIFTPSFIFALTFQEKFLRNIMTTKNYVLKADFETFIRKFDWVPMETSKEKNFWYRWVPGTSQAKRFGYRLVPGTSKIFNDADPWFQHSVENHIKFRHNPQTYDSPGNNYYLNDLLWKLYGDKVISLYMNKP